MSLDLDHPRVGFQPRDIARWVVPFVAVVRNVAIGFIAPIVVLVLWEYAARSGLVPRILFPAPTAIWKSAVSVYDSGRLADHITASVSLQLTGLAVGSVLGVTLGLLVGLLRSAEDIFDSSLVILQAIPTTAVIPLFIIWFGGDQGTRVLVVALAVFFPVYVNTLGGIRLTDRKLIEVGRILNFGPINVALRILVPHALPQIFVGIRQSLKMAWVGVVAAELLIASSDGIYFMMMEARSFGQTPIVYLGLILFGVFGVVSDLVVGRLQRIALPWTHEAGHVGRRK
ncbi:ABC transporter permease [Mesorhizobium sp. CAU 1732]|uniref:ABC transporter permease n=1 Tax=Mesorhizobium sp. CAU 1732 TaxID=3140358 RepID=UPI00326080BA